MVLALRCCARFTSSGNAFFPLLLILHVLQIFFIKSKLRHVFQLSALQLSGCPFLPSSVALSLQSSVCNWNTGKNLVYGYLEPCIIIIIIIGCLRCSVALSAAPWTRRIGFALRHRWLNPKTRTWPTNGVRCPCGPTTAPSCPPTLRAMRRALNDVGRFLHTDPCRSSRLASLLTQNTLGCG